MVVVLIVYISLFLACLQPFIQVGLRADSQTVRDLACKTVGIRMPLFSATSYPCFSSINFPFLSELHLFVITVQVIIICIPNLRVEYFLQVTFLLEESDNDAVLAIQLIIDYGIYPLLLECLLNG